MAFSPPNQSFDFYIGKDNLSNLRIQEGSAVSGFYYFYDNITHRLIKRFVLGESKTGIKTCVVVALIKKGNKYTPRLEFSKRSKNNALIKNSSVATEIKISARIDFENCYDNFWDLIDFIRSFNEIETPQSGYSAIRGSQRELLDRIELNSAFVDKVLATFSSKEAQSLLIRAKQHDIKNLHAAIKQAKNKQSLLQLKNIIKGQHYESQLQRWINENDWVFGIEYIKTLDFRSIGIGSSSDFVVESLDSYADLIELKKADHEHLFNYDASHDSYYPNADLSQVVGQSINYLKKMNDARHLLGDQFGAKILKPRAKVVIGRSIKMNDKEKEALRLFNDSLHGIEIFTYDEIFRRAKTIIKVYDENKEI